MFMPPPQRECPKCKGSGRNYNKYLKKFIVCFRCHGKGSVPFLEKKYNV
jgi:DnaJ-class molecular chaperone